MTEIQPLDSPRPPDEAPVAPPPAAAPRRHRLPRGTGTVVTAALAAVIGSASTLAVAGCAVAPTSTTVGSTDTAATAVSAATTCPG